MFRLMRNIHLILGLSCLLMALVFAVSSLTIIYRPWLPQGVEESERTIEISADRAATPRALALELMRFHDLEGDLRAVEEEESLIRFRIFRPGEEARVEYDRARGEATVQLREWNLLEKLVQLHVNHGLWHDFMASNLWAALSVLASIGLLLLGVSGIYLWFAHHQERKIGAVILALSLAYGVITLALTRMA